MSGGVVAAVVVVVSENSSLPYLVESMPLQTKLIEYSICIDEMPTMWLAFNCLTKSELFLAL